MNVQKKTKQACPSMSNILYSDQKDLHNLTSAQVCVTFFYIIMNFTGTLFEAFYVSEYFVTNRDVMYGWCSKCRAKFPDEYNKLEG